ncbi:S-adenosyl-L-methionine-dependent methyltransferase [Cristinia sonorae]|uniref:S-adenosyl-L-methionine-dependent methyltransferase n=1 Tax=Cristinia sonorae TaxID=1940300 RepID=A0A8K0XUD1_9AGAR|nr:S-adenosyl-L-methionine-dependent methyltransferase [Cristinia sonorae]
MSPPTAVKATIISDHPQTYEDEHVHAVYDEIAPHFSSTRYKPWPIIARFIASLPTGWVGLDSGTGNGKYLPLPLNRPGDIWTIGVDRSRNLLSIARKAGEGDVTREVVWGDVLGRPWRDGAFDYAISIATIHHLSTAERRKAAVQRIIQSISPSHGRALIYVWAIEQDDLSKRSIPSDQTAALTDSTGQDVFVPWVLTSPAPKVGPKVKPRRRKQNQQLETPTPETSQEDVARESQQRVFNRYYHMFAKGELTALVHDAARGLALEVGPEPVGSEEKRRGLHIVEDGWERSNYYVEFKCWECT